MSTIPLAFTKLIVDDVDKMAAFYSEVYGLKAIDRIQSEIGGDRMDEIILGANGQNTRGIILLKFVDKKPPAIGEVILGFITDRIDVLFERILAAGGGIHSPIKADAEKPYKVGFVTDPEGHLTEIVEMVDRE